MSSIAKILTAFSVNFVHVDLAHDSEFSNALDIWASLHFCEKGVHLDKYVYVLTIFFNEK
jgi:hypothetical protein